MDKTKNTAIDLHNALFAQLERLSEEDLISDENEAKLERELMRTKSMVMVSDQIIELARVQVEGARLLGTGDAFKEDMPRLLC